MEVNFGCFDVARGGAHRPDLLEDLEVVEAWFFSREIAGRAVCVVERLLVDFGHRTGPCCFIWAIKASQDVWRSHCAGSRSFDCREGVGGDNDCRAKACSCELSIGSVSESTTCLLHRLTVVLPGLEIDC